MNTLFPNASKAIQHALKFNENQHGKGVHLGKYQNELEKAKGHFLQSLRNNNNDEDGTTHLCSAVIRLLKALEIQESK